MISHSLYISMRVVNRYSMKPKAKKNVNVWNFNHSLLYMESLKREIWFFCIVKTCNATTSSARDNNQHQLQLVNEANVTIKLNSIHKINKLKTKKRHNDVRITRLYNLYFFYINKDGQKERWRWSESKKKNKRKQEPKDHEEEVGSFILFVVAVVKRIKLVSCFVGII